MRGSIGYAGDQHKWSGRAEGVVSKVFSVLSPLVSSSQYEDLRIDLLKPAIDIWNDAQTGELKVTASPSLKPAHREEWRVPEA